MFSVSSDASTLPKKTIQAFFMALTTVGHHTQRAELAKHCCSTRKRASLRLHTRAVIATTACTRLQIDITTKSALICCLCTYRLLWIVQKKLESAHREAQVLEIKRQGQMKALEAQRAKKEVCLCLLAFLPYIACIDCLLCMAAAAGPECPCTQTTLVILSCVSRVSKSVLGSDSHASVI